MYAHIYEQDNLVITHTVWTPCCVCTHSDSLLVLNLGGRYWLGCTNTSDLLRGESLGPVARMYSGRFSLFSEETVGVCLPRAAAWGGGEGEQV